MGQHESLLHDVFAECLEGLARSMTLVLWSLFSKVGHLKGTTVCLLVSVLPVGLASRA